MNNCIKIIEAENRLHIIIDILAYIPAKHIQICFMNNKNHVLILSQQNKTPKMFQQEYHELISKTFKSLNLGGTPTLATLKRGFQEASLHQDPTSHYLLTDGVPSDASVHDVSQLILHRAYPQRNPLTLISCTNVDHECEWMKEVLLKFSFSLFFLFYLCIIKFNRLKNLHHILLKLMITIVKELKLCMIKDQHFHILKDFGYLVI